MKGHHSYLCPFYFFIVPPSTIIKLKTFFDTEYFLYIKRNVFKAFQHVYMKEEFLKRVLGKGSKTPVTEIFR